MVALLAGRQVPPVGWGAMEQSSAAPVIRVVTAVVFPELEVLFLRVVGALLDMQELVGKAEIQVVTALLQTKRQAPEAEAVAVAALPQYPTHQMALVLAVPKL